MSAKAAVEAAKKRREANPVHAAALNASLAKADDLHTTCQKCRKLLRGTIADLQAHVCQSPP